MVRVQKTDGEIDNVKMYNNINIDAQ